MSTDDPVPVRTHCEKADLEIHRQGSKVRGLPAGVDSAIHSLGGAEQNTPLFCAVSQSNWQTEAVVLGTPILR